MKLKFWFRCLKPKLPFLRCSFCTSQWRCGCSIAWFWIIDILLPSRSDGMAVVRHGPCYDVHPCRNSMGLPFRPKWWLMNATSSSNHLPLNFSIPIFLLCSCDIVSNGFALESNRSRFHNRKFGRFWAIRHQPGTLSRVFSPLKSDVRFVRSPKTETPRVE